MKKLLKAWIPPAVVPLAKGFYSSLAKAFHRSALIEYEHLGKDWDAHTSDPALRGWNVQEIVEAQESKWSRFVNLVEGSGPLGLSHESQMSSTVDVAFHNTVMTFAYVLLLASRGKDTLSVLDWGGGLGHYYVLAKTLLPEAKIDYHCIDLPMLAQRGSQLLPDQHFSSDESFLERTYDLVMASSSLHYSRDWKAILGRLARASQRYLFVTRTPVVQQAGSFVFVQRPYAVNYNTEYIGWCLNRVEFLVESQRLGLRLVREFVVAETPYIFNAPEQCSFRGFLFTAPDGGP